MTVICLNCHTMGKTENQGSIILGIVLLCCWVVPGIIYILWCLTAKLRCSACKSTNLAPLNSIAGQQAMKQTGQNKPRKTPKLIKPPNFL